VGNAIRDGQRNDHLTKLVGHLLGRDVDALVVAEIARSVNQTRCEPPLPDAEVIDILESIAGRERRRRAERSVR
jgi:hypothetical protein